MIKITMSNSTTVEWTKEEYDNYRYDGKCFVIEKNGDMVGIYNIDYIIAIIID